MKAPRNHSTHMEGPMTKKTLFFILSLSAALANASNYAPSAPHQELYPSLDNAQPSAPLITTLTLCITTEGGPQNINSCDTFSHNDEYDRLVAFAQLESLATTFENCKEYSQVQQALESTYYAWLDGYDVDISCNQIRRQSAADEYIFTFAVHKDGQLYEHRTLEIYADCAEKKILLPQVTTKKVRALRAALKGGLVVIGAGLTLWGAKKLYNNFS